MSEETAAGVESIFAYLSFSDKGFAGIPAVQTKAGVMPLICLDASKLEGLKEFARQLENHEATVLRLYRFDRSELIESLALDARPGKIYHGLRKARGQCTVTINGEPLPSCTNIVNHSPTGFEWGYEGSGPAQLAFAILHDCMGDAAAHRHYQAFKREVVSGLPDIWVITETQINEWLLAKAHEIAEIS